MPPIESSNLFQKAVLWQWDGQVDTYGRPKVQPPEELSVRWESSSRDTQDSQGRKVSSEASVRYRFPLPVNSLMWLGKLVDLNDENPTSDVMQIVSMSVVPDLKGRITSYMFDLTRYNDSFPTVLEP